jgi:hypothetical protein
VQATDEIADAQELVLEHRLLVKSWQAAVAARAIWGSDLPLEPPRFQELRVETLRALTGDFGRVSESASLIAETEVIPIWTSALPATPPRF